MTVETQQMQIWPVLAKNHNKLYRKEQYLIQVCAELRTKISKHWRRDQRETRGENWKESRRFDNTKTNHWHLPQRELHIQQDCCEKMILSMSFIEEWHDNCDTKKTLILLFKLWVNTISDSFHTTPGMHLHCETFLFDVPPRTIRLAINVICFQ